MNTKELGNLSPTNFGGKGTKQNISGKNASKLVGDEGEKLACEYLVKNGYKILGRNYRINFGEIDIIAERKGLFADKTVHFVEVKALRQAQGDFFPEEKVDYKKQNKYKRLAEIWLEKNKFPQNYPCQVDIIAVSMDSENPKIDYFKNVVEDT